MDWVIVALLVAPVLAVVGILYVLRVVERTGRDLQTLADKLQSLQPPPETEERPSD